MNERAAAYDGYRKFAAPDVILLATDLDSDVDRLLPHATAQALASSAVLKLVHVIPPSESIPLDASAILPADEAEMKQAAEQKLYEVAAKIRSDGVPCDILLCHGSPSEVIPDLAFKTGAGRVILGTHGRRHWKKMLLGSVAYAVLHRVEVPICTIGPHVSSLPAYGAPRKILHPVSLSAGYERSARTALEIAQFYKAEILLLHVLRRASHLEYDSDRVLEWTRAELERLIPQEAPLWTVSSVQVELGTVVEQIRNIAGEMNPDLIVLGVSPEVSFWPVGRDNTAYEIILEAKCPVLTVRR